MTLLAERKLTQPLKDEHHGRRLMEEQDTLGGIVAGQFGESLRVGGKRGRLADAGFRQDRSGGPVLLTETASGSPASWYRS